MKNEKIVFGPKVLFFFVLLFSCFVQNLKAQERAVVKGTITDSELKTPLPGANVVIVGTTNGTTANFDGQYSLFVTEGSYELEVSYLGNETKKINVEVSAGEVKILNIELVPQATALDDVVVTGALEGQQKALNQQKSADNLKSIVSADQMGKFPDQNSAESLQRVSGVNLQRDEGDGRFVLVRGLAPQFTNISINGEQIPSPEGESRFVALDAIPSNQLASLEVSKSITPDMDGDAIGGSVNLNTPTATKRQLSINGSAALEYNGASEKTLGQGSINISKRSNDGKFGFIANGSYAGSKKANDRYEFDGWGDQGSNDIELLEIADYQIERNRFGASTTLDYRGDHSNFYIRGLFSELREHEVRRRATFETVEEGGETEYTYTKELKDRPENQGVLSLNFGGNTITPSLIFDYEISYSKAWQDTPRNDQAIFESDGAPFVFNVTDRLNPKLITLDGNGPEANPMTDLGLLEFKEYEKESTLAEDENITFKANLALPFKISDNTGEFKFGGKLRLKDKQFTVRNFELLEYEGDESLTLDTNNFADDFNAIGFMDGSFNTHLGHYISLNSLDNYINANQGDFASDADKATEEKTSQEYFASEDVYAAYVMGKINFKKLMVLGGFRYEATKFAYDSGIFDEEQGEAIDVSGDNDYGFLLPMLHLKYNFSENTILRGSATKSYSRPNFLALAQGAVFNSADLEAEIFNPDLVPVEAINLDIFGEHYFGTVGLLSAGIFYKKLDNFIYQQTTDREYRGIPNVEVTQSVNGDTADLIGFEVGYQQKLDFLPGFLSGFVLYANYSFTESKAEVQNFSEDDEITEIDLPGQAKHVGNAAVGYNRGGFDARLSLNYNGAFTSEFDGSDAVRIDDRVQLDFTMSQSFAKRKLTAYLELININDENQIELYNTIATPRERQRYGSWGRLGLRFNF
ncbi:TonB-dependent receptor [Flagellimonas amoyensis]|uniref:TonB-dependent receptor n=1 Tax=Flagellimonas amoyensis TaxID=2169401 RepID=UPI000D34FC0B|nr:TonB-dependent receptor [Allomuricauda amoyensis]